MSTTLPHGLITVGYTNKSSRSSHHADVLFERFQILHSFWKVHAVRHRVSKDVSDFRCQNLFWRTWGDSRLSKSISTATLTALWSLCQQSIDSAALKSGIGPRPTSPHGPTQAGSPPPSSVSNDSDDVPESLPYTSTGFSGSTLRQESLTTLESKPKRSDAERVEGLDVVTALDSKPSKSTRPQLSRAGSSGIRTSFGASGSRTKGRPSINRRKSSQGAPQNKPAKLNRIVTQSPVLTSKEMEKVEEIPSAVTTSTFELPSASSWEDEPTMGPSRLTTSASYTGTSSDLVEPDFRNKFAERIASSNNLAGISRMKKTGSVVRFVDEVPDETRRDKDKDYNYMDSPPNQSRRESVASVAIIDEDESDTPPIELTRTKSQLSMLINETRSRKGRKSTEYMPSTEHMGLSSRRKREPTDEEKVLAMAHGEGFTRAGGRQIRRGFKINDEDETRYSSPSPPPIF